MKVCEDIENCINSWITNRNFERTGYRKFTNENKLRIINEWRTLRGQEELK